MMDAAISPLHALSSGLCEDVNGEALALIRRMARGDAAALAELHAAWSPVLLGIACRMLGDRREADDVLHQTFLRIWKRAADHDPHQMPPFVWAFLILRGIAIDRLRRGHGKRESGPQSPIHYSDNPKPLTADDCVRLRSAIDPLDTEDLTCLHQAVFLDFARRGNGEAVNPAGLAVKNRLRRALESVRNQLSRHEL
jgi:RNA polymerase sigma-70 factor, ECF subfamily